MEQHSERVGPRSGPEPQIQAPGDVGDDAQVAARDVEDDADAAAWDEQEAPDVAEWDGQEDADAVTWDAQQDAEAAEWEPGEAAAEAIPVSGEPEERPATGEPRVDAALARLDELGGLPVTEHRAVFEDVHRRLRDVLGELDTREHSPRDQTAAGAERRAGR